MTNTSAVPLSGTLQFALPGLPALVTLENRSGQRNGVSCIALPVSSLAPGATVKLSTILQGSAGGGIDTAVVLDNGVTFSAFTQAVGFGGVFSFDVRFLASGAGDIGSQFGVALLNATLTDYLPGTAGDIVSIALFPGSGDEVWHAAGLASVSAIPAPGSLALLAIGAAMLWPCRRRTA